MAAHRMGYGARAYRWGAYLHVELDLPVSDAERNTAAEVVATHEAGLDPVSIG
jgi:hypothetical protein